MPHNRAVRRKKKTNQKTPKEQEDRAELLMSMRIYGSRYTKWQPSEPSTGMLVLLLLHSGQFARFTSCYTAFSQHKLFTSKTQAKHNQKENRICKVNYSQFDQCSWHVLARKCTTESGYFPIFHCSRSLKSHWLLHHSPKGLGFGWNVGNLQKLLQRIQKSLILCHWQLVSYDSDRLGSSSTTLSYESPLPPCTDSPVSVSKQWYLQLKLPSRIRADSQFKPGPMMVCWLQNQALSDSCVCLCIAFTIFLFHRLSLQTCKTTLHFTSTSLHSTSSLLRSTFSIICN